MSYLLNHCIKDTRETTLRLPNDCIYDILKHFKHHYYRGTLFNCLFVNRFWCRTAVPLLYADPFKDSIRKGSSSVISTLILCFNKSEILQLKNRLKSSINNQIINIEYINDEHKNLLKSRINNHINHININIEYINDGHKPLFDYVRYLKNYEFDAIDRAINDWLKLSHFSLPLPLNERKVIYKDILKDIYPLFHQSLSYRCNDIKELYFSTEHLDSIIVVQKILSNMENICLNLRKLETTIYHNIPNTINEKLCMIIQRQNNLEAFKLSSSDPRFAAVFVNDIVLSLEFQKHSLVYLEFYRAKIRGISFKNFLNLYNLKHLEFRECGELSMNQCEIFSFSSFKLEMLVLYRNKWDDDVMSKMIKYLGAPLKDLVVSPLTISIIESISLYCSNLTSLDIYLDSNTDSFVCPYFKNLKIRKLFLRNNVPFKTPHSTTLKNVTNLANNLSTSVKEVYLIFDYHERSNFLYFKAFLKSCHNFLEIIYFDCRDIRIRLDLLKIILDYTERSNSLKIFYIDHFYKLNAEESLLLSKIRDKDVRREFIPNCRAIPFRMFNMF